MRVRADEEPVRNAWIASWFCAQQLTEPHNLPPSPGFPNSTLRQIVQLSLGGERLRVSFSNEFGDAPPTALTGHPGSRMTSYLQLGDAVSEARLHAAQATEHWYFISEIDVFTDGRARAIVTLGDSITDGRGSTTDGNDRWPNLLSRRLAADPRTARLAVLNQGVGGNRVIEQGLGVHALGRFERDVLGPPGVRWLVIFEGINDLGASPPVTGDALILAFRRMIALAHAREIRVIGGTLLPFEGAAYYTAAGESGRQAFNEWLRHSGELDDGVIDFDAIGRHPQQPRRLSPLVDGGDALHPCAAGYRILADAIDLSLFRD